MIDKVSFERTLTDVILILDTELTGLEFQMVHFIVRIDGGGREGRGIWEWRQVFMRPYC